MRQLHVDVVRAPDALAATVALSGDIDMSGSAALRHAVDEITRTAPSTVYVDLSTTTFAGSTLLTFLVMVRAAIGDEAQLLVRRPSPLTRHVIESTGIGSILTFDTTSDTEIHQPGRQRRPGR